MSAYAYKCREADRNCVLTFKLFLNSWKMNQQQVYFHLVCPKSFGLQEKGGKTQFLMGLTLAQQEELSETTRAATVFPILCFLCPAAVPLLSMSQISNDRSVCAGCTKRACLWQLFMHLNLQMMGGLLEGWQEWLDHCDWLWICKTCS